MRTEKTDVLTSRSDRNPSEHTATHTATTTGSSQQLRLPSTTTGPTKAIGLPPRRPSLSQMATADLVIGLDEGQSTSAPPSRRSSMNDDSHDFEPIDGNATANGHRLTPTSPPASSGPAVHGVVSSSPKNAGRKVSPRPSQYRTDLSGIGSGSSKSGNDMCSSEPPVYSGISGSNIRKKSAVGSSLPRGNSGVGTGVASSARNTGAGANRPTSPGATHGVPRRTVLSFNEEATATSVVK